MRVAGEEDEEGGCVCVTWSFVGMVRTLLQLLLDTFETGTRENNIMNESLIYPAPRFNK